MYDASQKSRKANKCPHPECKKKIKITDFKCKCNKTFCSKHRPPEMHDCDYDYKCKNPNEKIEEAKCVEDKIERL